VPLEKIVSRESRELKRIIHYTIKQVGHDIGEERQFNTAVARLMELSNALGGYTPESSEEWHLMREGVEALLRCLSPFSPHICEELWEMLANSPCLALTEWPSYEEDALVQDVITVVYQENGKVRERLELAAGLSKEDLEKAVLSSEAVAKRLEGKEIRKIIVVPDKLVNVVVK
jgi:leucyl-tRNA synthetase